MVDGILNIDGVAVVLVWLLTPTLALSFNEPTTDTPAFGSWETSVELNEKLPKAEEVVGLVASNLKLVPEATVELEEMETLLVNALDCDPKLNPPNVVLDEDWADEVVVVPKLNPPNELLDEG